MPNGHDKNWVRFCAAVDGFRLKHGDWPTRLRVFPGALESLEALFSNEDFRRIQSIIALVADEEGSFIAEDDQGRQHNYGQVGFPPDRPIPSTRDYFRYEIGVTVLPPSERNPA